MDMEDEVVHDHEDLWLSLEEVKQFRNSVDIGDIMLVNGQEFAVAEICTTRNAEHDLFAQIWCADGKRFLELIRFHGEDEASLHYGSSTWALKIPGMQQPVFTRFDDRDLRQVRAKDGSWQIGYSMPE